MTATVDSRSAPSRRIDWPRIIYGDWSWFVRDWLDVIRLVFIGGTIVFAVQGRHDVGALTAASVVLLIARIVDLPRWFDFGLTVAMSLIAWGTALHLYGDWFYYDKVVHGISPAGYTPVIYIALVRLGVVPDPGTAIRERRVPRIAGIFIVSLAVGMAVGAGYENVEWLEDKWNILGGHFVKGLWDTETDLLCDAGGSLAGATFLTIWSLRGWSSRRTTVHAVPPPGATPVERIRSVRSRTATSWRERLDALPSTVRGAVGVAAGVVLLAWPSPVLRTVGIVIGVAFLARAALDLVDLLRRHGGGRVERRLAEIVLEIGVGTLVIWWPGISQAALLYTVGAFAVVAGALEAVSLSSGDRSAREQWLGAAAAVAAFVFGVAMLGAARDHADRFVKLAAAYLVVLGVLQLVRAARDWRASWSTA
jgi:uncharacterized membrane protein HdeD (DUF308 family)/uncharacterized membrane protein YjdF